MATIPPKIHPPQAFMSSYAPRLRSCNNPLLVPAPPAQSQTRAKRGTTIISYAEDGFDDSDFEDNDGFRRVSRSSRRFDHTPAVEKTQLETGIEATAPVEFQGIWRDWIGRAKKQLTEKQAQLQAVLPLHLIPIRIDLEIPAFRPEAAFPTPANSRDFGIDENLPAYKPQDPTPPYRLKDFFLWNVHEALTTPDQFARVLVDELDLPNDRKPALITQIANQIRQQLEECVGIAMHPLFQTRSLEVERKRTATQPGLPGTAGASRDQSATPRLAQMIPSGDPTLAARLGTANEEDGSQRNAQLAKFVVASAEPLLEEELFSPDDIYRCIIHLNINLLNQLYTDKFEWSLLHPPGLAEEFARQTCADLGLAGEWAAAIAHGIYEAVFRLKKEVCEAGVVLSTGLIGDVSNDAAEGAEAGWRYDYDRLCDEWEPKLETLLKEEIEKREGDRERQLRRLRRETARFSNVANVPTFFTSDFGGGSGIGAGGGSIGGPGGGAAGLIGSVDGEWNSRSQRSRRRTTRLRSPSPAGGRRDLSSHNHNAGVVGGATSTNGASVSSGSGYMYLTEAERQSWRCLHCHIWGSAVWALRDGPMGPRTLCHNCGFLYDKYQALPPWSDGLFAGERPVIGR